MNNIFFQKVTLDQTDLLEKVFRLRYRVYAHECGFISPNDFPDQLEIDVFDQQSVHFAAVDAETGDVVGTMRLILPGCHMLPIEDKCRDVSIREEKLIHSTEISRLVVCQTYKRKFRKKMVNSLYDSKGMAKVDRVKTVQQSFKQYAQPIIFGLCQVAYEECLYSDIKHIYALMEPRLRLLLGMLGLKFECVGDEIDYYGQVRPYKSHLSDIIRAVDQYQFEVEWSEYSEPSLPPPISQSTRIMDNLIPLRNKPMI